MSITQVHELQENYLAVSQNRWLDKRMAYMLARCFVGTKKHFDFPRYKETKDRLKAKLGTFHLLQAPILDAIVTLMMVNEKTTDSDIDELLEDYQRLLAHGFARSSFTYFAALLVTLSVEDKDTAVSRAQKIFQAIKADHPWITSSEDTPLALILALQPYLNKQTPTEIADTMEQYYQGLKVAGFSLIADLQYAAASCTNYFGEYIEDVIPRIKENIQALKELGFSVNHTMYISIVTLTYVGLNKPIDFQQIKENEALIKAEASLRFNPQARQQLAIGLYTTHELHRGQSAEASQLDALSISIMILQEEVAMMAAMTAVMASSSTN